jgi:hypothetical protein
MPCLINLPKHNPTSANPSRYFPIFIKNRIRAPQVASKRSNTEIACLNGLWCFSLPEYFKSEEGEILMAYQSEKECRQSLNWNNILKGAEVSRNKPNRQVSAGSKRPISILELFTLRGRPQTNYHGEISKLSNSSELISE